MIVSTIELKNKYYAFICLITFLLGHASECAEESTWKENWLKMNRAVHIAQKKMSENIQSLLYFELDAPRNNPSGRNRRSCAECGLLEFENWSRNPENFSTLEEWIIEFLKNNKRPILYIKVLNEAGKSINHDLRIKDVHDNIEFVKFKGAFDGLINIFIIEEITIEILYPVYLARRLIRTNLYSCLKRELEGSGSSPRDILNKRALRAQESINQFEIWMRKPQIALQMRQYMINYLQRGIYPPFTLKILNEKGKLEADYITLNDLFYKPNPDFLTKISFRRAFRRLQGIFMQEKIDLGAWLGVNLDSPYLMHGRKGPPYL